MEQYIRIAHDLCSKIKIALCNHKEYELAAQLREFERSQLESIGSEKELLSKGDISGEWLEKDIASLKAISYKIEAAEKYADHLENTDSNFSGRHYDYVTDAFKAGAEWLAKAKKEGYTITDSQIKHLFETIGDYSDRSIAAQLTLREWFPNAEVFAPKTMYKIGQKFKNAEHPSMDYELLQIKGNIVAVLVGDLTLYHNHYDTEEDRHIVRLTKVEDINAITKDELTLIFGEDNVGLFTLIEPSNPCDKDRSEHDRRE